MTAKPKKKCKHPTIDGVCIHSSCPGKPKKKRPPKVDKTSVEETNVRGNVAPYYGEVRKYMVDKEVKAVHASPQLAALVYDLEDLDANEQFKVVQKANALQSVIWNFNNYLRQEVKYNSDQYTEAELAIFNKVRAALWAEIKLQECEGVLP
jgi:hypothetical protein